MNRPDKVLSKSPYADENMVNLYAEAVRKREDRLGTKSNILSKSRPKINIDNKFCMQSHPKFYNFDVVF